MSITEGMGRRRSAKENCPGRRAKHVRVKTFGFLVVFWVREGEVGGEGRRRREAGGEEGRGGIHYGVKPDIFTKLASKNGQKSLWRKLSRFWTPLGACNTWKVGSVPIWPNFRVG